MSGKTAREIIVGKWEKEIDGLKKHKYVNERLMTAINENLQERELVQQKTPTAYAREQLFQNAGMTR